MGLLFDQTVFLQGFYAGKDFPDKLRRIGFFDAEKNKRLVFLTNNFSLSAMTITQLYKCRWQVELFFKWIKQHLRIKAFYRTSENALKTQIWTAITVYVLVAIVKKRLNLEMSLYRNTAQNVVYDFIVAAPFYTINILFILLTRRDLAAVRKGNK